MILLRQNIASEVRTIIKSMTVERHAKVGVCLKDRTSSTKFNGPQFHGPYVINFPAIRLHIVKNVIVEDQIALHDGVPILDHLLSWKLGDDGKPEVAPWFPEALLEATQHKRISTKADDTPTLVLHNEGGGTWGHWLAQALPKAVLFKQSFPEGKLALPYPYTWPSNNFGLSLELYGISRDAIVPIGRGHTILLPEAVFIDHLHHSGSVHPAAIDLLSQANVPVSTDAASRLFISRPGNRNIANMDEVVEVASSFEFELSSLGSVPVTEQASAWRHGSRFMGVLGSDLTGLVFAKPDAEVLSITPHFHGDMFFFDLAAAKGLRWHELLCGHLVEMRSPLRSSSFSIDPIVFHDFLSGALGA